MLLSISFSSLKTDITSFVCLLAEGDVYFTVKLQNYTAVEKDEVILSCELSKATADVKWFKDGKEIFPSKNILIQSDGKKRMLVIKKAAKGSAGSYTCSCGTDKTTSDLNIEGNLVRPAEPASLRNRRLPHHSSITATSCFFIFIIIFNIFIKSFVTYCHNTGG